MFLAFAACLFLLSCMKRLSARSLARTGRNFIIQHFLQLSNMRECWRSPAFKLFFACPNMWSGPPVDTARMCLPSDGQVCTGQVAVTLIDRTARINLRRYE